MSSQDVSGEFLGCDRESQGTSRGVRDVPEGFKWGHMGSRGLHGRFRGCNIVSGAFRDV